MKLRTRPLLLTLAGLTLLASFGLGLRWGLYLPPREMSLVTYALMDPSQDPATTPATAVLYANGQFALLTQHYGYVGQKLDPEVAKAALTVPERYGEHWAATYPSPSGSRLQVAVLHLTLADGQVQTILIDDPLSNPTLPRNLRSFLTTLTRQQYLTLREGASIDQGSLPLRLFATPLASTVDPAIYDVPLDYSFAPLLAPDGFAAPANDALVSVWHLSDYLMAPGNTRVVRLGGQLYHLTVLVDWLAAQR